MIRNTSIWILSFILLSFQISANETDKTAACAGVVMGDGAVGVMDHDEGNFDESFKLAFNAYYGHAFGADVSNEDAALHEQIMASNFDMIYLTGEWTFEVYNEVLRCYRFLGIKILENSKIIKKNAKIIKKYEDKYKERVRRLVNAQ